MAPGAVTRDRWARELDRFTALHEGWLVSLAVAGQQHAVPELDNRPLLGVSADRVDHHGNIAVSVLRPDGGYLTHVIRDATRLYVMPPNDGTTATLLIDAADDTRTVVQVRATALAPLASAT